MAKYSITVSLVPGAEFTVQADSVDELMGEWEHMKGDGTWLTEKVMEMVPATESGEGVGALSAAVAHAIRGDVVDAEPVDDVAPDEPEPTQERVDPWSGQTVREPARRRSTARTAPSRGNSPHPASRPQSNTGDSPPREVYDRYDNKYVIGLPDAPMDENGHGPMVLKTWTNQAGKTFTAYKCPNQAPGGNYSQKCDAHAWPPR